MKPFKILAILLTAMIITTACFVIYTDRQAQSKITVEKPATEMIRYGSQNE